MQHIGIIESLFNKVMFFLRCNECLRKFDIDPYEISLTNSISLNSLKFKLDYRRGFHGMSYWWVNKEEVYQELSNYKVIRYHQI